jgi:transposase
MIIKIDDDFRKHGLTLEEAFILARVRSFEDNGLEYNESNEALAEMLGKGKTTIKTCINELVEKGLLQKKVEAKSRMLFTQEVKNEHHAEVEPKKVNRMSNEELLQFMQEKIQQNKKMYKNIDEEFY